jgi:transketolase
MKKEQILKLEKAAYEVRKNLLTLASKKSIHIGGDLSITDVMTVLWQYQMHYNPADPHDENRDRFVLSKGHASAALNFCQAAIGCYGVDDVMKEYDSSGGRFSMHPCSFENPYIEVSTGSLGHGLSIASGIAMALRLKHNWKNRVYVIMGDGEQSEGSVWEAAMNSVHYNLGNLVAIIDQNGLESDWFRR